MHKLILVLSLVTGLSFAGELDDKKYCRTVETKGQLGQPDGKREHCISFENDVMTDDGSTFFGNPPESISYVLVAGKILIVRQGKLQSSYSANKKLNKLSNGAGAVLSLQE